jgi:hypothetical protein
VRALIAKAGQPGKDGVAGANGLNGLNGRDGYNGANGGHGSDGATGATGAQGIQGEKGSKGDHGEKGDQGSTGEKGEKAEKGDDGAKGDRGDDGAKGDKGDQGDQGAVGTDGLGSDVPRDVIDSKLRGWTLAPKGDSGSSTDNGTLTFEAPPVSAPLGSGALRMVTSNGKTVAAYLPLPAGTAPAFAPGVHPKLSDLTTAGYSSLSNATPADSIDVSFQIEVTGASVGTSSGYATIVYEPYQNGRTATPGAFQRHDVRAGKLWATRAVVGAVAGECSQVSPCTMSRFMELNADAVVQTVKLRIGQNSGLGWDGWVGYADDVRLGFDGDFVRYDLGA